MRQVAGQDDALDVRSGGGDLLVAVRVPDERDDGRRRRGVAHRARLERVALDPSTPTPVPRTMASYPPWGHARGVGRDAEHRREESAQLKRNPRANHRVDVRRADVRREVAETRRELRRDVAESVHERGGVRLDEAVGAL